MTRDEKITEAQRLRVEGLTNPQIARLLGVTTSTVWKWLNPERARELHRRDNAARNAAKRAWEREYDRKPCPCGAPRGSGKHRRNPNGLCRDCWMEVAAVGRAMREERIAEMWAQGLKLREIADALDSTLASIASTVSQMRKRGWDLPRRKNWTPDAVAAQREIGRRWTA